MVVVAQALRVGWVGVPWGSEGSDVPVETKWTLSSMFHLAAAVAESPPPMMPLPPFWVSSATASKRDYRMRVRVRPLLSNRGVK